MQQEPTRMYPPLGVRRGVLVVDGYGVKVYCRRGRLLVEDGIGPERRSATIHRATSRLRRLVIVGHEGFVTLEAFRWMADVGVGFYQIDRDGRILVTPGTLGTDKPALRRAQAGAARSVIGISVTNWLLEQKLAGQSRVLIELGQDEAVREFERHSTALAKARTPDQQRLAEAMAANVYWSAWADVPIRFARADTSRLPEHWLAFGGRGSPLAMGARLAVNPANAVLNYLYAILEAECRIACLVVGLDPGIGILHSDQKARDSLALDIMEAVRPTVDAWVLDLLGARTFRAKDFFETRQGVCRVLAPLTHELAELAPALGREAGAVAEHVAGMLSETTGWRSGPTATPLTQANRRKGRDGIRRTPASSRRAPGLANACRLCGVVLEKLDRLHCDECLAEVRMERGRQLGREASEALARLRAEGLDPSATPEAKRKHGEATARRNRERAAWNREHPGRHDSEVFRREVLPGLQELPLSELIKATGLTKEHVWRIRRGDRVPHPMHWEALKSIAIGRRGDC